MKLEKSHKIVIAGVLVYVVLMLIIFLPGYLRNKNEKLYILSGDFIKIKYENGSWHNITDSDDYKLKEFETYESSQYKGKYKILFTNKYYLYNENGKTVDYNGQLFAYSGTIKLGVVNVSNSEITDNDRFIINKALSEVAVSGFNNLNLFQKVSLDADKDGITDNVYAVSNYYVEESLDKVFSIVFTEENGNINILEKKVISSDKVYEEGSFEINKIIDVKDDKKYEVIIEQSYFSRPEDSCVLLHRLDENKKLIENLCK